MALSDAGAYGNPWVSINDEARAEWIVKAEAAFAAVLDDMKEPSEGTIQAIARAVTAYVEQRIQVHGGDVDLGEIAATVIRAMLAQYRKEVLGDE